MPSRNSLCSCGSGKRFKHCHGRIETIVKPATTFPFAARFDQLSLSTCYIELFANKRLIGNATGFFWRCQDNIYLLTNWHVVTNKDIFTGDTLDGVTCPNVIRAYASFKSTPDSSVKRLLGENARGTEQHPVDILVYDDVFNPLWSQHRDCDTKRIDVVALKLTQSPLLPDLRKIVCINDYGFEKLLHFSGSELFIIGFPMKEESCEYRFPIWKNGTIAREPFAGWKGRPALLVDSRTSKGMSGSPVVRRVFGPMTNHNMETNIGAVVSSEFLGIYSGRLHDGDKLPSIGIVWWRSVIEEMLANPAEGNCDLKGQ